MKPKGGPMSRINKALLRKAKSQLRSSAKSGDEQAQQILSRRKARQAEKRDAATGADFERPTTEVAWNFSSGELVTFKRNRFSRYGLGENVAFIVVETEDRSWVGETALNSLLDVLVPGHGIIKVRAADMKKL